MIIAVLLFAADCSVATLQGSYGVQRNGHDIAGTYTTAVGVAVFDGAGGVTGHETVSTSGKFAEREFTGTYTVHSDCSVQLTDASGDTSKIMITAGGETLFGMSLATGRNESTHYERIPAPCTEDSFSGTYAFQRNGRTSQGDLLATGTVTATADGRNAGSQTIARNGAFSNATVSNAYTINADCSGSLLDSTGNPFGAIVIVHGGSSGLGMSLTAGNNVVIHYDRIVATQQHDLDPGQCHTALVR